MLLPLEFIDAICMNVICTNPDGEESIYSKLAEGINRLPTPMFPGESPGLSRYDEKSLGLQSKVGDMSMRRC
eukprot:1392382-Amorphochlora_amoeboformis.AAC.1